MTSVAGDDLVHNPELEHGVLHGDIAARMDEHERRISELEASRHVSDDKSDAALDLAGDAHTAARDAAEHVEDAASTADAALAVAVATADHVADVEEDVDDIEDDVDDVEDELHEVETDEPETGDVTEIDTDPPADEPLTEKEEEAEKVRRRRKSVYGKR